MFAYFFSSFYYSMIVLVISFNQFNAFPLLVCILNKMLVCLTLDCFCWYVSLSVLWINKSFKHWSMFLSNGKNKTNSLHCLTYVFLSLYVNLKKLEAFTSVLDFLLVPYFLSVFKMTVCLSDCSCHSF
jgi:hypothetical protein